MGNTMSIDEINQRINDKINEVKNKINDESNNIINSAKNNVNNISNESRVKITVEANKLFEMLLLCDIKVFLLSLIILFDSEINVFFACFCCSIKVLLMLNISFFELLLISLLIFIKIIYYHITLY